MQFMMKVRIKQYQRRTQSVTFGECDKVSMSNRGEREQGLFLGVRGREACGNTAIVPTLNRSSREQVPQTH